MPPGKLRKKKTKRRLKSKSVTVKLTGLQMLALKNYCRLHKTTPNRVIRERLSPFVSARFRNMSEDKLIQPNQLDLFD